MLTKRGFEFSFAWLFAIIVGAFILFTAIYAAVRFLNVGVDIGNIKTAKEISIIFNPLETGLASGKSSIMRLNLNTRIYNKCSGDGNFGSQEFSVSQKSGFTKDWPVAEDGIVMYNKYVFSDDYEEGKEFYFFSKPFEMPFKISEIIFLTSKRYCFLNAPDFIEDEVKQLELKNVKIENCSSEDKRVCFGSGDCDIVVYGDCSENCNSEHGEYSFGHTTKNGKEIYYIGSLVYASIFSSPELYECNFKRLMMRIRQISYLYKDEVGFLASRGCGDAMTSNLINLAEKADSAKKSSISSMLSLKDAAEELDMQNSAQGGCRIY